MLAELTTWIVDDRAWEAPSMGERTLRGSRLGAVSYESDASTELAPRQPRTYNCPQGHETTVPFAADADVPALWECRTCGANALLVDSEMPEPKKQKPPRTHWDMLLERRSLDQLEELLEERLELLRGGSRKSA